MAFMDSIKKLIGGSKEPAAPLPEPPRPTSLTERKRRGMDVSTGRHQDAMKDARKEAQTTRRSDDPYATAAWEVDPNSGRRRLARVNPLDGNKAKDPDNPYDTSTELDPWRRG